MADQQNTSVEQMNEEARVRLTSGLQTKGAHLSFEDAVADFPAGLMNEKPANVPYSFWHQLEHIRITQRDMIDYIKDPGYSSPNWPRGYWPPQDAAADSAAWQKTLDDYLADRSEFIALINDKAVNLLAPVEHLHGQIIMRCALIIIDHNAYHLGEFVMGRQILGAWKSMLA